MKAAIAIACTMLAAVGAAEKVNVVDCARDPALDEWAASDAKFACMVMDDVFKAAGVEGVRVPYRQDGMSYSSNAEVVCSAFRTERLLKDYDYPLQPLGRMHFALFAMPARAAKMMSVKITDWPRMRVGEATIRAVLPERVLVVDDMTRNRKILGIHLTNLKIKDIRYAENGEEALTVMKEWIPDLVLSDMWMPKMDGSQLAEAMRKERRLAEIPIVAVTADVDVGATYDMSLFAKIIAKPVTSAKLRALFGDIGSD